MLGGDNSYTGGTVVGGGTLALTGTPIGSLSVLSGVAARAASRSDPDASSSLSRAGGFHAGHRLAPEPGDAQQRRPDGDGPGQRRQRPPTPATHHRQRSPTTAGQALQQAGYCGSGPWAATCRTSASWRPATRSARSTVGGNFTSTAGGIYQVEVNGSGQSDLINVGGTATLQGGTVQVCAQPGTTFAASTTYTHPQRRRRRWPAPSPSVNELYPFLLSTPELRRQQRLSRPCERRRLRGAAARRPTQRAVGAVLDANVNDRDRRLRHRAERHGDRRAARRRARRR